MKKKKQKPNPKLLDSIQIPFMIKTKQIQKPEIEENFFYN